MRSYLLIPLFCSSFFFFLFSLSSLFSVDVECSLGIALCYLLERVKRRNETKRSEKREYSFSERFYGRVLFLIITAHTK